MSSEVETSLNISEIVRDSSTSVGMTKNVRERTRAIPRAFTIIELLVVIAIIIILAGLILSTVGYVQKKGARSRAEAEIAAMSAALESYKADNGIYPTDLNSTEKLKANLDPDGGDPSKFIDASKYLYKTISGDTDGDPSTGIETKPYLPFKPNMLSPNNTYVRDPL